MLQQDGGTWSVLRLPEAKGSLSTVTMALLQCLAHKTSASLTQLNLILATFTSSPHLPGRARGRWAGNGTQSGFHPSCLQDSASLPRKSKAEQIYIPGQAGRREVS